MAALFVRKVGAPDGPFSLVVGNITVVINDGAPIYSTNSAEVARALDANPYVGRYGIVSVYNPDDVPAGLEPDAGFGRVLLWSDSTENYEPASLRSDTSRPREFIGPVDPADIGSITGPVFGDRWTPTEASE